MTDDERATARNEIAELMQRYARASDLGDKAAYAECYVADGVLDLPGGIEHRGHEALRNAPKPKDVRRRHYFMPPVLTFSSASEAEGDGYCLLLNYNIETKSLGAPSAVDYRTSFRKTPDGWRIVRHAVRLAFAD